VIEAIRTEILYLTVSREIVERVDDGPLILADSSNWFRAANFLRTEASEDALYLIAQSCARRRRDRSAGTPSLPFYL
jgi:hypothetical protein